MIKNTNSTCMKKLFSEINGYLCGISEKSPQGNELKRTNSLSNGKKIKYLFGGRDLLLRSGIFCVRSSATGNKNNETSVTKIIS